MELKNCKCGQMPEIWEGAEKHLEDPMSCFSTLYFYVICRNEKCNVKEDTPAWPLKKVITDWNKRVDKT